MALQIRNCAIPSSYVPSDVRYNTGGRRHKWLIWEILRLAGWSEQFKDSDSNWTASERFSPVSDAAVVDTNAQIITSSTALFQTNGVVPGDVASLEGSLGHNTGMYRIVEVPSESQIVVAVDCVPSEGWVTESGMDLKVSTCATKSGEQLADATEFCMTPPSGSCQLGFASDVTDLNVTAYPKGDVTTKGTGTGTTESNFAQGSYMDRPVVNAYVDGQNGIIYIVWDVSGVAYWSVLLFGELEDVCDGDDYPGFYAQSYDIASVVDAFDLYHNTNGQLRNLYMLDDTFSTAQTFKPVFLKRLGGLDRAVRREAFSGCRIIKGGAPLRRVPVYADVGASPVYRRGKLPVVRSTWEGWEKMRPFDSAGQWLHAANGLVIPRGGPNDPLVREATLAEYY